MPVFSPPANFVPGTIERLLKESYTSMQPQMTEKEWRKLMKIFEDFDHEVATHPEVARCTFVTEEDGLPIGLGSFDPRQRPALGLIGHNVLLPSARGKGYGKLQLQEILRRMQSLGIKKVRVSTGEHPFFTAAQKNYESVGFRETRRFVDEKWSSGQIEYEMEF
ncbi:MAG: GNAT family N-acetyltransferase [Candidatus Peribacteraceae bacterium]|nr:GNAT family N-acetyltransferase [Candidatus Peribacteraceae bacterium]